MLLVRASAHHGQEVEDLVYQFFPDARKTHQICGTQKFELPPNKDARDEFTQALIQSAEDKFSIQEWDLTPISLEEILSKMITGAEQKGAIQIQIWVRVALLILL